MKMSVKKDKKSIIFISICLAFLLILGILALYSATYGQGGKYVVKQLTWNIVGLVCIGIVLLINYKRLLEASYIAYLAGIALLILVMFMGETAGGAHRWVTILGINFQPSEFMKLILILTLVRYLSSYRYEETGTKTIAGAFALTFIPVFLIIKQPDLGTALIFIPVLFVMVYVWSGRLKHIILTLLAGFAISPFLWMFLKGYQRERLLVFLNPNIDPLGAGYTIIQSKIAVGSGGIFGKGWLEGTQSQLDFLPETHTDFIFSSIGEEWGLVGALVIIFLFLVIIWQGFIIAAGSKVLERRLLACGISTLLALHVIINIGMSIGLMPIVGLPLPFISYGGSHTVMFLIMIGILINIKLQET
jgi:rod shape determining protein RodA